jgi:hypothetical protein
MDVCKELEPDFKDAGGSHFVACWLYDTVPSSYVGQQQAAVSN